MIVKAILWAGWLACLAVSLYTGSTTSAAIHLLGAMGFGLGIIRLENQDVKES